MCCLRNMLKEGYQACLVYHAKLWLFNVLVVILWHKQHIIYIFWTSCEFSILENGNNSFEKEMMFGRSRSFKISLEWASLTKSYITLAEVRWFVSMLCQGVLLRWMFPCKSETMWGSYWALWVFSSGSLWCCWITALCVCWPVITALRQRPTAHFHGTCY